MNRWTVCRRQNLLAPQLRTGTRAKTALVAKVQNYLPMTVRELKEFKRWSVCAVMELGTQGPPLAVMRCPARMLARPDR